MAGGKRHAVYSSSLPPNFSIHQTGHAIACNVGVKGKLPFTIIAPQKKKSWQLTTMSSPLHGYMLSISDQVVQTPFVDSCSTERCFDCRGLTCFPPKRKGRKFQGWNQVLNYGMSPINVTLFCVIFWKRANAFLFFIFSPVRTLIILSISMPSWDEMRWDETHPNLHDIQKLGILL